MKGKTVEKLNRNLTIFTQEKERKREENARGATRDE